MSARLFLLASNAIGALSTPLLVRDIADSVASFAPAAATVSTDSPAGAALFPQEAVQLTEDALRTATSQINEADVYKLFGFGDSNETAAAAKREIKKGECKAFPGDSNYPREFVWSIFDSLLGGALIKTTPVASPCYKESQWNNYDEAKCEDVSARFTTADLQ
jgi:hypothetical protein